LSPSPDRLVLKPLVRPPEETCFFEQDPGVALARRAAVEGVGTMLLTLVICGSGLTASRLFAGHASLGLLVSAAATPAALVGMVLAFGAVSGGHFNPLITGIQWLARERKTSCALAYIAAQIAGGLTGAFLATVLFGARHPEILLPADWRTILSEGVASAGLMIVVFGCARSGRAGIGPFAVGIWLGGAILAFRSTSYANPAVTLAALVAAGPMALPFFTVVAYVAAEMAGAFLALGVISVAYPRRI
jgi:glycerol uptake facilitator-like aquaporin